MKRKTSQVPKFDAKNADPEVQSQTPNKTQRLADCGHMSASSQSLCFSLSLRMNSSFITLRPDIFRLSCVYVQCKVRIGTIPE